MQLVIRESEVGTSPCMMRIRQMGGVSQVFNAEGYSRLKPSISYTLNTSGEHGPRGCWLGLSSRRISSMPEIPRISSSHRLRCRCLFTCALAPALADRASHSLSVGAFLMITQTIISTPTDTTPWANPNQVIKFRRPISDSMTATRWRNQAYLVSGYCQSFNIAPYFRRAGDAFCCSAVGDSKAHFRNMALGRASGLRSCHISYPMARAKPFLSQSHRFKCVL